MESLWLSLMPHSLPRSISSIILRVVYHSTANGQPNHIRTNLDSLLMKQPNALVMIAGDFNPTSTGLKLGDLTQSNNLSIDTFKMKLKTHLFKKAFCTT